MLDPLRIAVELASLEDLPAVAALYRDWVAEGRVVEMVAESPAQLRERLGPFFWIAREENGVVGFIKAIEGHRQAGEWAMMPEGGALLSIEDLHVVPRRRSQRIGSALMRAALGAANDRGIEHVAVYSWSKDWIRLSRFYASFGIHVWFIQYFG